MAEFATASSIKLECAFTINSLAFIGVAADSVWFFYTSGFSTEPPFTKKSVGDSPQQA
jgi:hypothetical protein